MWMLRSTACGWGGVGTVARVAVFMGRVTAEETVAGVAGGAVVGVGGVEGTVKVEGKTGVGAEVEETNTAVLGS